DVTTQPLPHETGTVDLVDMSAVLHVIEEPLPVLAEIRRVLRRGGVFLLHDWIRQPLSAYLAPGAETSSGRVKPRASSAASGCSPFTTSTLARTGSGCWPMRRSRSGVSGRCAQRTRSS